MSLTIFVAVAATAATVTHLLLRSFWMAVTLSAVITSLSFFLYDVTLRSPVDPFANLASVFAGVYGAGISGVLGVIIRPCYGAGATSLTVSSGI